MLFDTSWTVSGTEMRWTCATLGVWGHGLETSTCHYKSTEAGAPNDSTLMVLVRGN